MNIQLRTANRQDLDALCSLLTLLFTQESEFTPDPANQLRGLAHIIEEPATGLILLAQLNGEIIGMVNLLFTISTALGERVALLEDMILAPQARQQGIGSQLLQQAISLAGQAGCHRITLLTDASNHAAQHFYRHNGFQQSGMLAFRLKLKQ
jgi:GNAT superfamily N-acetyltransferase